MTLSTEAKDRLSDIVELQPTKNGELQDKWGMDSGSDVHSFLESELKEYYYRDEDSLICATPEAMELVGEGEGLSDGRAVRGTDIQAAIVEVLPGPDEQSQSVVATLHDLEDDGFETDVDSVRSALHTLTDKGIATRISKTVPTFRLALERENIDIEVEE
jgi:hypothetical protein